MSTPARPIQRILIVGGATAGWMAAAYLKRALRGMDCTVTLMESVKLGTSSIGAATDPALVKFLRELRIDENQLMRETSATYQLGAKLVDGIGENEQSWLPFGLCGGTINGLDLFPFWLKSVRAGRREGPYSSYSLQALLAEQDKAPRPAGGSSEIIKRGEYAYHLDTVALADFLRELATGEGVNHLFDDVRNIVRASSGAIDKIETKSGRALSADLYLDCTAEGLVIEQGLGDSWMSWSALFQCDRAVVLPLPRDPQMHPYTQITRLTAGWMRHVPLSHRVASSYCYASGHLEDGAAIRELLARASSAKASSAEPRYFTLRLGRRQNFWLNNCIALGQAAGCPDPVVAAEMRLIQRGLSQLMELFPDSDVSPSLSRAYNERMAAIHDGVRDFGLLHYLLSGHDEAPFWRESKSSAVPETLQNLIALHDENGYVAPESLSLLPESSYHHLFAAANRLPRRPLFAAEIVPFPKVCEIMEKMKLQNQDWLALLPPHREVMEQVHRAAV